jgi:glycosyltransferase involved in cell wall biosynthesis
MTGNKKIFIILIPGFPSSEDDSTCLPFQQSFTRTLQKQYPDITVLVLSFQYPYKKGTYRWNNIEVISFDGRNKGGLPRRFLWLRITRKLEAIKKEAKIVGVLSFWCGECALVGKKFADRYGIKHFCWIMGQDAKKENKYVKKIRPGKRELIALSDFLQEEFERNHQVRPGKIIYPGIDPSLYKSRPPEKNIDIIGVGSLIPLKQYDIFIEAIAEIKKRLPDVKAILVGEGPERKNLQKMVAVLNLQSNIILTGELPHPEVLQLMQQSKVLLHPSAYEGFVMVCLEALFAGSDVVSFVRPVKNKVENWHTVANKEEMKLKTFGLLKSPFSTSKKINNFLIQRTANEIISLFL